MTVPSGYSSGLSHPLVWLGVILGTLVSLYVINAVWWLTSPLIISLIFCFLSRPVLIGLNKRGFSREQALFTYLIVGSVAVLLVILIVLPWVAAQLYDLRSGIPVFWERLEGVVLHTASRMEKNFPGFEEAEMSRTVALRLGVYEGMLLKQWLPNAAFYVVSWIPPLLIVPYLALFILKDGAKFKRLVLRGVPNAYFEKILLLFHQLDFQVKQYFRGLMAMTLLDTITLALGLWLIGLPQGVFGPGQALFLGLFSAVLAWIPYVGTAAACLVIVMVCLTQAPGSLLLVAAAFLLFVLVRIVDDFIYTPMTVGKSLRAHPLLTVMVVFAAGYIGGVLGLLLAMPMLGIWMALGEIFGQVWFDDRLRARYRHTRQLRRSRARKGLSVSP